jgi:signal peptidase I
MRPWLRRGDVVVVEAAPIETISRGEVIVFRAGEEFVTHRVIQITPRGMLTKGDALRGFDPLCDISQILGRVFQVERNDKVRYNFHSRLWRIVLPLLGTLHAGIGRAAARFRRMRKSISTKKPS